MSPKTILIIDKDTVTRKFLKHTLQEKGYTVHQAESGKEGLVIAWRDQPDVIVVDPNLPDLDGDLFIKKIRRDARTASMPVIALSSNLQTEFAEACLAQGYSVYFPKSGEAIPQLLQKLEGIEKISAPPPEEKRALGKLFVFLSAKGGTGTSSLCANIAMNINEVEPDAKVVVADMVLPIGSISSLVGYKESINLTTTADLPPEEVSADFLLKTLPNLNLWRFQLLASMPNPEASNLLQVKNIPHIIEMLREAYDYVVIDLGRSLSRISLPIIQQADLIALILTADKSTVTLTKTVVEYLQNQKVNPQKLYPILNRAVGLEGITKAQAEEILELEIKTTVPYMGGNLTVANNQSQPITHKFPSDIAAIILQRLTKKMIEKTHAFKK